MKLLRDHPIPVFIAAFILILAGVLLNHAWEQDVDVTLTATEYRLDDPDYAVEHTVTIRGRDARSLWGKGRFEGTVSVSGLEGLEEEQAIVLSFPDRRECILSVMDEDGRVRTGGHVLGDVFPNRDYSEFVWLLANEVHETDASYGGGSARFLISGPAGRETAFALGAKLTKGSLWESLFTE